VDMGLCLDADVLRAFPRWIGKRCDPLQLDMDLELR